MGCRSDYLEPNARELESVKVLGFLKEMGFDVPNFGCYGNPESLDADTAALCDACKNVDSISKYSLELQIWWRDHQLADKKRIEQERKSNLEDNPNKKLIFKINNRIADNKKTISKIRADRFLDVQKSEAAIYTLQEVNRNLKWVKDRLLKFNH